MGDMDDRVRPISPISSLRVSDILPYGFEKRQPDRKSKDNKRKSPESEPDEDCIITPDKVDCKV